MGVCCGGAKKDNKQYNPKDLGPITKKDAKKPDADKVEDKILDSKDAKKDDKKTTLDTKTEAKIEKIDK